MARVLAISSHVAYGSVGLAATVPALQALGHEVVAVPTIILSNHPGYETFAGDAVPPASVESMIAALGANGWLAGIDAVLTGYLPTAEHVGVAERAILSTRAQSASALVVVDPVLGDDPGGVYIPEAAAIAIRDRLLRHARLLTPNRFELAWLSGLPVGGTDEAAAAALALPAPEVLATSIPAGTGRLATILTASTEAFLCRVERRPDVPHGTGDLLTALFLGHLLNGEDLRTALGRAAAAVEASVAASLGQGELSLAGARGAWIDVEPLPTAPI